MVRILRSHPAMNYLLLFDLCRKQICLNIYSIKNIGQIQIQSNSPVSDVASRHRFVLPLVTQQYHLLTVVETITYQIKANLYPSFLEYLSSMFKTYFQLF